MPCGKLPRCLGGAALLHKYDELGVRVGKLLGREGFGRGDGEPRRKVVAAFGQLFERLTIRTRVLTEERITTEADTEQPGPHSCVGLAEHCRRLRPLAAGGRGARRGLRDGPRQHQVAEEGWIGQRYIDRAQRNHLERDERRGNAPYDRNECDQMPDPRREWTASAQRHWAIPALYWLLNAEGSP